MDYTQGDGDRLHLGSVDATSAGWCCTSDRASATLNRTRRRGCCAACARGSGTGDGFLLGVDLVKDEATLLAAYDDAAGVTAAFNRNLLVRLNRELDAEFEPEGFAHCALWNEAESRIEMHLGSRGAQRVHCARSI